MKSYPIAMLIAVLAAAGCASQHPSKSTSAAPSQVQAQRQPQGWYLMQPPIRDGNPDTSAKLSEWQSIAFFARPADCDTARARGLAAYPSYVPVSGAASNSIELSQRLASSSLCVAADDPRINWFYFEWKWK
jgi:hypothetical protein